MNKKLLKHKIIRDAWNECTAMWDGMAYMTDKSTADGGTVQCERVMKFNRKSLVRDKVHTADVQDHPCDKMINKVGQPGSDERMAALIDQYAKMMDNEESPFA